jgi:type I restriction enzyme M protein
MALTASQIERVLPLLAFKKGRSGEWVVKKGDYTIKVVGDQSDSAKIRADFGDKIKIGHKGIQNLSNPENVVVVDAVLQLLERGYKPEHLELEPKWKLGHGEKGRLDILVRRPNKRAYAMVECKSWGAEYAKEGNNLLEDGRHLFSYSSPRWSTDKVPSVLPYPSARRELQPARPRPVGRPARPTG